MIVRFTGTLESVGPTSAIVALESGDGAGTAHELLIPVYLAERLKVGLLPDGSPGGGVGARMTFHTMQYLEAQGQGASFIPRTLGFGTPAEREFFELFTSVKGLGNKRATRALTEEPAVIARSVAAHDVKGLQRLPEIGKKLAETIVLELREKVQPVLALLGAGPVTPAPGAITNGFLETKPVLPREAEDAVVGLMALGQTRQQAERMVALALQRNPGLAGADEIVSAACMVRI